MDGTMNFVKLVGNWIGDHLAEVVLVLSLAISGLTYIHSRESGRAASAYLHPE